ncbi:hypothetical protein A2335_01835 [Candidatus Peregrinibacteria bacterium RIFOXYB2_FULL_32_7]|nr:MAG: hypothetical protein A2335_01835 [Candidatus Peregrinibacteria bacterium RIFOXYB2_FULL_32_7]
MSNTPSTNYVTDQELNFESDPTDLSRLILADKDKVIEFVGMLNSMDQKEIGDRRLVVAIGTGGTISMIEIEGDDGKKIKIPSLDFDDIFQKTEPSLRDKFIVKDLPIFKIDSSQMQYTHVHDLAIIKTYIETYLKKEFAGFLFIHGTDTMAEASSIMANMLGEDLVKPIVYTGSQTSINEERSDAGKNVRDALYTLASMDAERQADIVIVFGDGIIYAYGAQKVHEKSSNAFDSPMLELAGELSVPGSIIELQKWTRQRAAQATRSRIFTGKSHLLEIDSKMSMDSGFVEYQIEHPSVRGVSIATYGAGTADMEIVEAAAKAIHGKQIPGFAFNPASFGAANKEKHAIYPSEEKLARLGFETIRMTPEFGRGKYELAIRRFSGNINEIRDFMRRQYLGEIPTEITRRRTALLRH